MSWKDSPEGQAIVDYVHELRQRFDIKPGPSARGLATDECGEMGQFVHGGLVCAPDFTGPWEQLSNDKYRERAAAFVEAEIAYHSRKVS